MQCRISQELNSILMMVRGRPDLGNQLEDRISVWLKQGRTVDLYVHDDEQPRLRLGVPRLRGIASPAPSRPPHLEASVAPTWQVGPKTRSTLANRPPYSPVTASAGCSWDRTPPARERRSQEIARSCRGRVTCCPARPARSAGTPSEGISQRTVPCQPM